MIDYKNKLKALSEKMIKLKEEESKLIEARKIFFGNLLERLDLLATSECALTGLLLNFKQNLSAQPHQLTDFEKTGEEFLQGKKKSSRFTAHIQASSPATSHERAID